MGLAVRVLTFIASSNLYRCRELRVLADKRGQRGEGGQGGGG